MASEIVPDKTPADLLAAAHEAVDRACGAVSKISDMRLACIAIDLNKEAHAALDMVREQGQEEGREAAACNHDERPV